MELKKRVTAQKPSNPKDPETFAKDKLSRIPADTCKTFVSKNKNHLEAVMKK